MGRVRALCAAAVSGCSMSKLVQREPGFPKFPKAPEASVVSVPGSPDFRDPRELKHPDRVQLAYARWQEQQRQPALAREAYEKALDHDPKSLEALLGLSRMDMLAGRTDAAAEHLEKAQKLHPTNPLVHAGWASSTLHKKTGNKRSCAIASPLSWRQTSPLTSISLRWRW